METHAFGHPGKGNSSEKRKSDPSHETAPFLFNTVKTATHSLVWIGKPYFFGHAQPTL